MYYKYGFYNLNRLKCRYFNFKNIYLGAQFGYPVWAPNKIQYQNTSYIYHGSFWLW